jgi:hypothetical protein
MTMPGPDEPVVFPLPVLVDTREQSPFTFAGIKADFDYDYRPIVVHARRVGLATGDYSLQGWEGVFAVERKGLADLYGTLSTGRERFEAELVRFNKMRWGAVVIEAGWEAIVEPLPRSRLSPKSVYRSILAYSMRFPNVHWFVAPDRRFAEVTTFRLLERWAKDNLPPEKGRKLYSLVTTPAVALLDGVPVVEDGVPVVEDG